MFNKKKSYIRLLKKKKDIEAQWEQNLAKLNELLDLVEDRDEEELNGPLDYTTKAIVYYSDQLLKLEVEAMEVKMWLKTL